MKKILVFAFVSIIFICNNIFSGQLSYQPSFPQEFDTVRFIYESEAYKIHTTSNKVFVYVYTSEKALPDAYEVPLINKQGTNKLEGAFKIPKFTIYIIMKAKIGDEIDNNGNNMWDFFIYKYSKTLKNANLIAGLTYLGKNPETIEREVDYDKALEHFKKEIEYYPNNIECHIAYISLQYDLRLLARSDFEKKMKEALSLSYDKNNESEVRALVRAYNALNKTKEAQNMLKEFIEKYKWSELAQEEKLSQIAQAASLDEFSTLIVEFLNTYPRSPSREKLFSALVSGYLQASRYRELRTILANYNGIPSSALSQLAFGIAEDRSSNYYIESADKMNEALSIMKYAVSSAKEDKALSKPSYYTYFEWDELIKQKYAIALEGLGKIYFMFEDYKSANDYLLEAKRILSDNSSDAIYEYLTQSYLNIKQDSLAFIITSEAISNNKATDFIYETNKRLFDFYGNRMTYQDFISSLELEAKSKRMKQLQKEKLNKKVIIPVLDSYDRISFDLNNLSGKIIILSYWATWCEPCKNLLLNIDDIYKANKTNDNLKIFAVNLWEKSENPRNAIKDYLKDSEISLPMLLDNYDEMPYRLGLTGLPTTVVIDKYGIMQFKITGVTSDNSYYQKIIDVIDYLSY